jgi:hypothetical protein
LAKSHRLINLILMSMLANHRSLAGLALFLPFVSCCDARGEEPVAEKPARSTEFAIAGIIDLDDDGMSDVGELRSLIADHNGTVVAYCASDGKIVGKLTDSTNYLIVGTPPRPKSKARLSFVRFVSEAKKKGVEVVPVSEVQLDSHATTLAAVMRKPRPNVFSLSRASKKRRHPGVISADRTYVKITVTCDWGARVKENEQYEIPVRNVRPVPVPNPFIRRYPGW